MHSLNIKKKKLLLLTKNGSIYFDSVTSLKATNKICKILKTFDKSILTNPNTVCFEGFQNNLISSFRKKFT